MENIYCSAVLDESNAGIKITGLKIDEDYFLDCSSDVDFTPVVSILTNLIDSKKKINFKLDEADSKNEKLLLVGGTLEMIIEKFNESIGLTEEDLSSENESPISSEESYSNDSSEDADLPF